MLVIIVLSSVPTNIVKKNIVIFNAVYCNRNNSSKNLKQKFENFTLVKGKKGRKYHYEKIYIRNNGMENFVVTNLMMTKI